MNAKKAWKPQIIKRNLGQFGGLWITTVARTRIEGTWGAYVGVTTGDYPEIERTRILDRGAKLRPEVAQAIFPELAAIPYSQ